MVIEDIINRKSLSERLEGNFDLFQELTELFLKESTNLLEAVKEAVKANNGEKIGKTAHTIKGAISNFSAGRAYQAALELEIIGKNNELDKAGPALQNLQNELEQMLKALSMMITEKCL